MPDSRSNMENKMGLICHQQNSVPVLDVLMRWYLLRQGQGGQGGQGGQVGQDRQGFHYRQDNQEDPGEKRLISNIQG